MYYYVLGLCHDLGHGPLSHLFDRLVLSELGVDHSFIHEHASIGIIDLLVSENELMPEFSKHNLTVADIHFVQELIIGDPAECPKGFEWVGRGDKTFLYDIVANKVINLFNTILVHHNVYYLLLLLL